MKKKGCSGAIFELNEFQCQRRGFVNCSKCATWHTPPTWLSRYWYINSILDKYDIDPQKINVLKEFKVMRLGISESEHNPSKILVDEDSTYDRDWVISNISLFIILVVFLGIGVLWAIYG